MNVKLPLLAPLSLALACTLAAQVVPVPRPAPDKHMKPADTEVFAPVPTVVTAPVDAPPSDAIVLFDGKNLDAWQSAKTPGQPAPWKIEDGALVVAPGTGEIATRQGFGDIQLHIEFREPNPPHGTSQGRGNSGIFLMGLYELQVLDSYNNPTYVNGEAGALYKQYAPLVNASRKPGEWQSYDVVWLAPHFNEDGTVASPARLTVFHNGVLVEYNVAALGPTMNSGLPKYFKTPDKLPLLLQDHHNAVAFRNIWVRELSGIPQQVTPAAEGKK